MDTQDRRRTVEIFDDLENLSRAAAGLFVTAAKNAIEANGRFTVALAGGSTPRQTYELLTEPTFRDQIRWEAVHVFWGDERCVPPNDPRSNARMARLALLHHVPVPVEQVHPIRSMDDPRESAADYAAVLHRTFDPASPRFDLVILGMGEDGHTASLFPGTPALDETESWVAAVLSKAPPRVTLTLPVLNAAGIVAFLVSGDNKANALQRVIEGVSTMEPLPAARVVPGDGSIRWFVDRSAAAKLKVGGHQHDAGSEGR